MRKYILAIIVFIISTYIISVLSQYYRGEFIIGGEFLLPVMGFVLWIVYQDRKSKHCY